jgi:hypothetical protein
VWGNEVDASIIIIIGDKDGLTGGARDGRSISMRKWGRSVKAVAFFKDA